MRFLIKTNKKKENYMILIAENSAEEAQVANIEQVLRMLGVQNDWGGEEYTGKVICIFGLSNTLPHGAV